MKSSIYFYLLATKDNHCLLYGFDGGRIDVKFRVNQGLLSIDYSLDSEGRKPSFTECITNKAYPGLQQRGYMGITSGNPVYQNVNEIDVQGIDLYNMNTQFYQHDAAEIVSEQEY